MASGWIKINNIGEGNLIYSGLFERQTKLVLVESTEHIFPEISPERQPQMVLIEGPSILGNKCWRVLEFCKRLSEVGKLHVGLAL